MLAKPKVRFFHLSNRGKDGQERPVYDEHNLPFFEGLCIQPLDDLLQPVGNQLSVPVKNYSLLFSSGTADPWQCIIWSSTSPKDASESRLDLSTYVQPAVSQWTGCRRTKGPGAAKSGPTAGRGQVLHRLAATKSAADHTAQQVTCTKRKKAIGNGAAGGKQKRSKQHEGLPQPIDMECSPPNLQFASTVPDLLQQLRRGQAHVSVPAEEEEVNHKADVHEVARRKKWM